MPVWYFNLKVKTGLLYWVDYTKLKPEQRALIHEDLTYPTSRATQLDAVWQAWQKGIVASDPSCLISVQHAITEPRDNYQFVKKYFNPLWSWYILFLRLAAFHNPFTEVRSFFRAWGVRRVDVYQVHDLHEGFHSYRSKLIAENPVVTVIIPTLNRYNYLRDALQDLEKQEYKRFEVIVIDQSSPFQQGMYAEFKLDIRILRQEVRALWMARNSAVKISKGEYILLFDDDSRVQPDWILNHLKCMDYFGVHISSGTSLSVVGAAIPKNYSYFRWGDQLDTGNALVRKEVFNKIGLFDRMFEGQRMGDGEFGLRAYLSGFLNISNPLANRIHLKVGEGGLREMGSWDAFRPKRWWAPRPVPSVLYLSRKYFGRRPSLFYLLMSVPPSIMPYRFKRNPALLVLGSIASLLLFPWILIQVVWSWKESGRMLKLENRIDFL